MMARKAEIVRGLAESVSKLLSGNRVEIVRGTGRLAGKDTVQVTLPGDGHSSSGETHRILTGNAILLATGSEPVALPSLPFDGRHILSSTEALALPDVPRHLAIIGGGYIGLELGSVWRRLGAQVSVIEMLPHIAASLDAQTRRAMERALSRQGFQFYLETKVSRAQVVDDEVHLTVESSRDEELMRCDRLLVAVGRRPLTAGLGLEAVGVTLTPGTGRIAVDTRYRTNIPSIYAIGDLIDGPMLAHKASAEGVAAVEAMV